MGRAVREQGARPLPARREPDWVRSGGLRTIGNRVPQPTNDNLFRPKPKPNLLQQLFPPDLRKQQLRWGVGVGLGPLLWFSELPELADDWVKAPNSYAVPTGDWYLQLDCGRTPGNPPYTPNNQGAKYEYRTGHVANCLAGQVPAGVYGTWPTTWQSVYLAAGLYIADSLTLSDSRLTPALRMRHDVTWWRDAGTHPQTRIQNLPSFMVPGWNSVPNPNWERMLPAPRPSADPYEFNQPSDALDAPPEWTFSNKPNPVPHARTRPKPFKREVKVLSKVAKLGIALWHALDVYSELTEIAGALYDALPKKVRDKWDCGDNINIGQYGTDTNLCELTALYHNWHLLDTGQAFMNIAKNVAEDMTIGEFHKWVNKLYVPGFSLEKTIATHGLAQLSPEKHIAGVLEDLFKHLGLE